MVNTTDKLTKQMSPEKMVSSTAAYSVSLVLLMESVWEEARHTET